MGGGNSPDPGTLGILLPYPALGPGLVRELGTPSQLGWSLALLALSAAADCAIWEAPR